MNLSVNPLKERSRAFLESENSLGFNKSQYQGDISGHIDKSLRYLFHILRHPYNLKKEDLYDKLNAQTLSRILQYLLQDTKEKSELRHEKYDFRTVELARLLFYISTDYLMKINLFEKDEYMQEDIKRVADRFYILSRSIFEKEQFLGQISEGKEHEINSKLKNLDQHEYHKLSKERSSLIKERETADDEEYKKLGKKIKQISEKRKKAEEDLRKKKEKLYKELENKYAHLIGFFCARNRLPEFEYMESPHKFSNKKDENYYYF